MNAQEVASHGVDPAHVLQGSGCMDFRWREGEVLIDLGVGGGWEGEIAGGLGADGLGNAHVSMLTALTALNATSDEMASWVDNRNLAHQQTSAQMQRHCEQEELKRHQQTFAPSFGIFGSSAWLCERMLEGTPNKCILAYSLTTWILRFPFGISSA
eukprot:TRINITY_DN17100_c0_g1_i1.p2 TRINITY_DN17100_c0_g1~~TRINITY_DN17100_c0_g1_i1.p2  ORF type:complete len:170 (+),score=3.13 TRINITY_DN17100_c0_g1_i1:43-510(+)